jgi:hypothetical protein
MYSINVDQLVASMLQAARGLLAQKWPDAKDSAESVFRKLGEVIAFIEAQRALNLISIEKAKLLMEMQKHTATKVLLKQEGLGILVVEAVVNAALDAVKETANISLGFVLI